MPLPGPAPEVGSVAWIACVAQSAPGTVTAPEKAYLTFLRTQTVDRATLAAIDRALAL